MLSNHYLFIMVIDADYTIHALLPKIACIQLKQQKRLPAAPKTGYDFHPSVVLLFDQFFQILLSLDMLLCFDFDNWFVETSCPWWLRW